MSSRLGCWTVQERRKKGKGGHAQTVLLGSGGKQGGEKERKYPLLAQKRKEKREKGKKPRLFSDSPRCLALKEGGEKDQLERGRPQKKKKRKGGNPTLTIP